MIHVLAFLVLTQFVEPLPQGAAVLRADREWVVIGSKGEVLQKFVSIDGRVPTSVALVAKGVAFTAPRDGMADGLFLKLTGTPAKDVSVSDGFHSWVAAKADGAQVIFSHRAGSGSGPPGQHAAGSNLQLWVLDLRTRKAQALTSSQGCKTSPRFLRDGSVSFVHNTCNGFQGVSTLNVETRTVSTVLPREGHRERVAAFSPSRAFLALVRPAPLDQFRVTIIDAQRPLEENVVFEMLKPKFPDVFWLSEDRLAIQAGDETRIVVREGSVWF